MTQASEPYRSEAVAPVAAPVAASPASYVDWAAIFAGTALAVALSFVLLAFGSAIGLSMGSFEPGEGVSIKWLAVAAGLWFIWVAVTSFAAGGYLAGRLRRPVERATPHEADVRDGAHGVVVWAMGAIIGAVLAASGVTGAVGAAGNAVGSAAQVATEAVGGDIGYLGGRLLRGDGADATAVLARNLTEGEISAEDRDYLVSLVSERTGQSPEEATAAVNTAVAEAQGFYADALATAERARVAASIAAFVIAATLMASAAAAYLSAVAGGDHRDRNLPFGTFGRG